MLWVLILFAWLFLAFVAQSALNNFSWSRLERLSASKPELLGLVRRYGEPTAVALTAWTWLLAGVLVVAVWHWTGPEPSFQFVLVVALVGCLGVTILQMWVAEPLGRLFAEPILVRLWPILNLVRATTMPLLVAQEAIDTGLRWAVGAREAPDPPIEEEIRTVLNEGARDGEQLIENAADMIEGLIELHKVQASQIMTPRTDMIMLRANDEIEEARRVIVENGHSRIPVFDRTRDDIKGVLYAKDLLPFLGNSHENADLSRVALRKPVYVLEEKPIDILLRQFQRERIHIAIVLDEYGGVAGLVTIEDILEEIVGEIADEHDPSQRPPIRKLGDSLYEVDGRLHVDEVNELIGADLPEDADYDTIGGFLFSAFERIPKPGETLERDRFLFTILDATDRTIDRVRIEVSIENESADASGKVG